MNKARHKKLQELKEQLKTIRGELGMVHEEEQEAFDNLPEVLQSSERGQQMEEASKNMSLAFYSLGAAIYDIEEAMK